MIKSAVIHTYEIDDTAAAVNEILSQLNEKIKPDKSMIGIVLCSYDFIGSGVIKSLSDALPFPVIGATTISQAVQGEAGLLMLTLMVLYSDDCHFTTVLTDTLPETEDISKLICDSYYCAKLPNEREKLILTMAPLQFNHSGDEYVNALSAASDRVPVFGTIAAANSSTYEESHVIFNGDAYKDRMAYVIVYGDVNPEFRITSFSEVTRMKNVGEITASDGNILSGVNGMPLADYLEKLGLASNGKIRDGINSIPFFINFGNKAGNDGVAIARAMYAITADGSCVCGGEMPIGATLTIGICDKNDVLKTSGEIMDEICEKYPERTTLMFSCIGRMLALGTEPLLEVQMAAEKLSGYDSFMLAYSGGEICPTSVSCGKATNRMHNYTFIACIL